MYDDFALLEGTGGKCAAHARTVGANLHPGLGKRQKVRRCYFAVLIVTLFPGGDKLAVSKVTPFHPSLLPKE